MRLLGVAMAALVALFAAVGCASYGGVFADAESPSARPRYKPGASLEARLCECRECFDRGCCDGDPDREESAGEPEKLGIAVQVCGRCVRRTWTVRGAEACSQRQPSECCAGSTTG